MTAFSAFAVLNQRVDPFLIYAGPGMGREDVRRPKYFAAADEPKSIWKVAGAEHTGGIDAQPAEYERRVVGFFDDVPQR